MTKQVITQEIIVSRKVYAPRSQKLAQFFRAVALFSMPLRSAKLGLRRRK